MCSSASSRFFCGRGTAPGASTGSCKALIYHRALFVTPKKEPIWQAAGRPRSMLLAGRGGSWFRFPANHPETDIFRRRGAVRSRIRGTIRAPADHLATAAAGQHPLAGVPAQIVNRIFVVPALAVKAARFLQQWRGPVQLFRGFSQLRRILRVRRIPGPVVESIFPVPFLIEALHLI